MTFLAPWWILLAVVAGVPVLVHLLRRRVTQRVEFPAVRFLADAERAHHRERTLRHRALLLLRVLAVLLVAFAAARPLVPFAASFPGAGHAPVALAIVLDQSASTGIVVQDTSVWQRQQGVVRALLDRVQGDDRAWMVTTAGLVVSGSPETLRTALDSLAPEPHADDVADALRRAYRLLDAQRGMEDGVRRAPVVVVVTDGQLRAGDAERVTNATAFDTVPPTVVYVTPVSAPPNHSIVALELTGPAWVPGATLTATVVRPRMVGASHPMAWRLDSGDRTLSRGTLDSVTTAAVEASGRGASDAVAQRDTVRLQWTPTTLALRDTGWIPVRLMLDDDALVADNQRTVLLRRAPPPGVAVRDGAGLFVQTALETIADDGRITLDVRSDVRNVARNVARNSGRSTTRNAVDVMVLDAAELETAPDAGSGDVALLVVPPRDPLRVVAANRALAARGIPWRYGALLRDTTAVVVHARSAPDATSVPRSASPSTALLDGVMVMQRYQLTSALTDASSASSDAAGQVVAGAGGVPWAVLGEAAGVRGTLRYLLLGSPLTPDASRVPISAAFVPWLTTTVLAELRGSAPPDSLVPRNLRPEESELTQIGTAAAWAARNSAAQAQGTVPFTLVRDERRLVRATFHRAGARGVVWPLLLAALLLLTAEGWLARPVGRAVPRR